MIINFRPDLLFIIIILFTFISYSAKKKDKTTLNMSYNEILMASFSISTAFHTVMIFVFYFIELAFNLSGFIRIVQ